MIRKNVVNYFCLPGYLQKTPKAKRRENKFIQTRFEAYCLIWA